MTFEEVFQLAQLKGYHFYNFNLLQICNAAKQLENQLEDEPAIVIELALIQKWLRDCHNVYIEVYVDLTQRSIEYNCSVISGIRELCLKLSFFRSYEQALADGIKGALELIPS